LGLPSILGFFSFIIVMTKTGSFSSKMLFLFVSVALSWTSLGSQPTGLDFAAVSASFVCPVTGEEMMVAVGEQNLVVQLLVSDAPRVMAGMRFDSWVGNCSSARRDWVTVGANPTSGVIVMLSKGGLVAGTSLDCGGTWKWTCLSGGEQTQGAKVAFVNGFWFVGRGSGLYASNPLFVSSDDGKTFVPANVDVSQSSFDGFFAFEYFPQIKRYVALGGMGYKNNNAAANALLIGTDPLNWTLNLVETNDCPANGVNRMIYSSELNVLFLATGDCCNPEGYLVSLESLTSNWNCSRGLNGYGSTFAVDALIPLQGSSNVIAFGNNGGYEVAYLSNNSMTEWIALEYGYSFYGAVSDVSYWSKNSNNTVAVGYYGLIVRSNLTDGSSASLESSFIAGGSILTSWMVGNVTILLTSTVDSNDQASGIAFYVSPGVPTSSSSFLLKYSSVEYLYPSILAQSPDGSQVLINFAMGPGKGLVVCNLETLSLTPLPNVTLPYDSHAAWTTSALAIMYLSDDFTKCGVSYSADLIYWKNSPLPFPCNQPFYGVYPDADPSRVAVVTYSNILYLFNTKNALWAVQPSSMTIPFDTEVLFTNPTNGKQIAFNLNNGFVPSKKPVLQAATNYSNWQTLIPGGFLSMALNQIIIDRAGFLVIVGDSGVCILVHPNTLNTSSCADGVPQQNFNTAVFLSSGNILIGGSRGFLVQGHV
jgi:hypothetical protein